VPGTGARAIREVRVSFSPAQTARTDEESTAACKKSNWPASRSFASSTRRLLQPEDRNRIAQHIRLIVE
jgi:hypothetical protein